MKNPTVDSITETDAASIIGSIFRVRRDLVKIVKEHVIDRSGVTLEHADVVVDLYGAKERHWPDPPAIEGSGGWVTFSALQKSVVNNTPELVTRRLRDLKEKGYVEIARVTKAEAKKLGIDAKSKKAMVTPMGAEKGREIHEKYGRVSLQLLHRLPRENFQDAMKAKDFNEALMAALRFGA